MAVVKLPPSPTSQAECEQFVRDVAGAMSTKREALRALQSQYPDDSTQAAIAELESELRTLASAQKWASEHRQRLDFEDLNAAIGEAQQDIERHICGVEEHGRVYRCAQAAADEAFQRARDAQMELELARNRHRNLQLRRHQLGYTGKPVELSNDAIERILANAQLCGPNTDGALIIAGYRVIGITSADANALNEYMMRSPAARRAIESRISQLPALANVHPDRLRA